MTLYTYSFWHWRSWSWSIRSFLCIFLNFNSLYFDRLRLLNFIWTISIFYSQGWFYLWNVFYFRLWYSFRRSLWYSTGSISVCNFFSWRSFRNSTWITFIIRSWNRLSLGHFSLFRFFYFFNCWLYSCSISIWLRGWLNLRCFFFFSFNCWLGNSVGSISIGGSWSRGWFCLRRFLWLRLRFNNWLWSSISAIPIYWLWRWFNFGSFLFFNWLCRSICPITIGCSRNWLNLENFFLFRWLNWLCCSICSITIGCSWSWFYFRFFLLLRFNYCFWRSVRSIAIGCSWNWGWFCFYYCFFFLWFFFFRWLCLTISISISWCWFSLNWLFFRFSRGFYFVGPIPIVGSWSWFILWNCFVFGAFFLICFWNWGLWSPISSIPISSSCNWLCFRYFLRIFRILSLDRCDFPWCFFFLSVSSLIRFSLNRRRWRCSFFIILSCNRLARSIIIWSFRLIYFWCCWKNINISFCFIFNLRWIITLPLNRSRISVWSWLNILLLFFN